MADNLKDRIRDAWENATHPILTAVHNKNIPVISKYADGILWERYEREVVPMEYEAHIALRESGFFDADVKAEETPYVSLKEKAGFIVRQDRGEEADYHAELADQYLQEVQQAGIWEGPPAPQLILREANGGYQFRVSLDNRIEPTERDWSQTFPTYDQALLKGIEYRDLVVEVLDRDLTPQEHAQEAAERGNYEPWDRFFTEDGSRREPHPIDALRGENYRDEPREEVTPPPQGLSPDYLANRAWEQKHHSAQRSEDFDFEEAEDLYVNSPERQALIASGMEMLRQMEEGPTFPEAGQEYSRDR
jgi:hypothetical protein